MDRRGLRHAGDAQQLGGGVEHRHRMRTERRYGCAYPGAPLRPLRHVRQVDRTGNRTPSAGAAQSTQLGAGEAGVPGLRERDDAILTGSKPPKRRGIHGGQR
jgi:hypothetical protein